MADVRIIPAQDHHLRELARRLRPADRAEITALGYPKALEAIYASAEMSEWVKAAVVDTPKGERVLAVWGLGVYADLPEVGGPWLLSTRSLERHKKEFLRRSRPEIAAMHARFPILRGLVDSRYGGAVRWIGWMGFHYGPPVDINGVAFLPFERKEG